MRATFLLRSITQPEQTVYLRPWIGMPRRIKLPRRVIPDTRCIEVARRLKDYWSAAYLTRDSWVLRPDDQQMPLIETQRWLSHDELVRHPRAGPAATLAEEHVFLTGWAFDCGTLIVIGWPDPGDPAWKRYSAKVTARLATEGL